MNQGMGVQSSSQSTDNQKLPTGHNSSERGWAMVGVVLLLLVVVGIAGYFTLARDQDQSLNNQSSNIESPQERGVVQVTLDIDAPFSIAQLTVNTDGSILYWDEDRGMQIETTDRVPDALSDVQMAELYDLIDNRDFTSLENRERTDDLPLDGSTYTISAVFQPPGTGSFDDAASHQVSCYQFACEEHFLKIKDFITEAYGKEIFEIGV